MNAGCPHILIVEDNLAIARVIEYSLCMGEQNFQFSHAYDGIQALALVESVQPDLITLDLQLPSINGLEIVQRLRSAGNKTPILMLTASQGRASEVEGWLNGCNDYLTKPFKPSILKERVEALLRMNGSLL